MQHRNESSVSDVLKSEGDHLSSQTIPILLATFPTKHEAHHIEPAIPISDSYHNAHGKRKVYPIKGACRFRLTITMAMIVAAADRDRSHPMDGILRNVPNYVQASITAVLAANRME